MVNFVPLIIDESDSLDNDTMTMLPKNQIKFDAPATYKIIVQGHLPEILYPYFDGMKILLKKRKGFDCTAMTGQIKDQAALAGLLNILYELHYPILRLESIDEKTSEMEQIEPESNPDH
jgi:hypothetical protein